MVAECLIIFHKIMLLEDEFEDDDEDDVNKSEIQNPKSKIK